MLFEIIIAIILFTLLLEIVLSLFKFRHSLNQKQMQLSRQHARLQQEEQELKKKVVDLENTLSERFLFYDTTRQIAPLLDKSELFEKFSQGLRYLGPIEEIELSTVSQKNNYLKFELGKGGKEILYIKTESEKVKEYVPYFAKLLRLCLERLRLYARLQQLSIYDSLTKIYNRRYFMQRFHEEFQRSEKFNYNLSFLMIDIDYFKKINDTYGHLVGDTVLREIARLIKKNIRRIDFLARFGGEEFAVILPETDKAGAIMLAERINSRIAQEKIKVFDEAFKVTVSIGLASFPQNTIHSDILIEVADKALYKAKTSGRNRVCWF